MALCYPRSMPLLDEGTNPKVVQEAPAGMSGSALAITTNHWGLMYNPDKVSAAEVPKTFAEMGDPKWKGKISIAFYEDMWGRMAYYMGVDKVKGELKAIVDNGAIQESNPGALKRYLLGETWMAFITSGFFNDAREKGMPAEWQRLGFVEEQRSAILIRKGAEHPNAAKLVAIYLASPEGAQFLTTVGNQGTRYYPGNFEGDLMAAADKMGIPMHYAADIADIIGSEEWMKTQAEIELILKGGG